MAVALEGRRVDRSRFDSRFDVFLSEYNERTLWDRERIIAFRNRRLRQTIEHAVATVPHYRDLFNRLRLKTSDVQCLEDLARLPVLTKQEVQKAPERFRSDRLPKHGVTFHHTSGSTGAGLRFPATRDFQREQWAAWWRYRNWHGLSRNTTCLYFGGRSVVPIRQQSPPFWRCNRAGRQILFSGYHLGPDTAPFYLDEMQRSGASWIHGYPSLVGLIARYSVELGVRLNMRWVTTGAESLLPQQSRIIEEAFGVRPIQHYGMAEGVANISQCPNGRLHVDEDFAAVEFLLSERGDFTLVGTSFANPAFPLLRYDTGDIVFMSGDTCDCGRSGRVVDAIDGRVEDFVITHSGAHLGRLDHIFKDSVNVREAQIRQHRVGHMTIHIVKGPHYGQRDEQSVIEEATKRVGDKVDFEIAYVDRIPRTTNGKLRFVVSSIDNETRKAA